MFLSQELLDYVLHFHFNLSFRLSCSKLTASLVALTGWFKFVVETFERKLAKETTLTQESSRLAAFPLVKFFSR